MPVLTKGGFFMKETDKAVIRSRVIIQTSIIGIVANAFLAGFKAVIGLMSNSIAIVMDAVNNLSDAASSVITIIGTKLAGKEADKKHPFGYGRIEYLSAMVISLLVLYAGITSFTESVKKMISPDTPDYSSVTMLIIMVGILVKIMLGSYFKYVGKKVNSDSLLNSGADALMDSVISIATLLTAVIYLVFHISLEAWVGAVIAGFIIKSGFEMLGDTLSKVLGERADAELARNIRSALNAHPEISGAYDLILHNYGPDAYQGSGHIEVPDTLTADKLDKLIRNITLEIYQNYDVILTAVGVYSLNTTDPEAVELRERISRTVLAIPHVLQMHGFYFDKEEQSIRFDVIVSFDAEDRNQVYQQVIQEVRKVCPDLTLQISLDTDFSEESEES